MKLSSQFFFCFVLLFLFQGTALANKLLPLPPTIKSESLRKKTGKNKASTNTQKTKKKSQTKQVNQTKKANIPKKAPAKKEQSKSTKKAKKVIINPIVPPRMTKAPTDTSTRQGGSVGGGIGFQFLDQDWFLTLNLAFEFSKGPFTIGISAPIRFRVKDNPPINGQHDVGFIRSQDWDEWTDYFKILKFIRLGTKSKPYQITVKDHPLAFYLRVGDLQSATIGHGTLLYHFYNNMHPDHVKFGLEFDFHTPYGGFEYAMDHLFGPQLVGTRIYVRPAAFIDSSSFWTRLSAAVSFVIDPSAPIKLKESAVVSSTSPPDEALVLETQRQVAWGFDLDLALLRLSWLALSPYMDFNFLGASFGYHLGLLSIFTIPVKALKSLVIHTRLEYRALGSGYVPQYFDSLYAFQRYGVQNTAGTSFLPKAKFVEQTRLETIHGFYGELSLRIGKWVSVGATFDDYQGPNNSNLSIFLQVPALTYFKFGAFYTKRGFDSAGDIFTLDEKSFLTAELVIPFLKFLAVQLIYQRTWVPETSEGKISYRSVDDFSFNFSAQYKF